LESIFTADRNQTGNNGDHSRSLVTEEGTTIRCCPSGLSTDDQAC
jgi:hypothetical protein